MVQFYKDGSYDDYITQFKHYSDMASPGYRLEEMYYESMAEMEKYEMVTEYALTMMNQGSGNYELHMMQMLKALNRMERFYEVLNFSDQLMAEDIPQAFRIDVASERHQAKLKLDEAIEERDHASELPEAEEVDLSKMSPQETLQFVGTIAEKADGRYQTLILEALPGYKSKEIVTFMLLYLRAVGHNREVEHFKFDEADVVTPDELPDLEGVKLVQYVLPPVLDHLETKAPQMVDQAKMLIMSHAIYSYPRDFTDVTNEDMAAAYIAYILDLINVEHNFEPSADALSWIGQLEDDVAGDSP